MFTFSNMLEWIHTRAAMLKKKPKCYLRVKLPIIFNITAMIYGFSYKISNL